MGKSLCVLATAAENTAFAAGGAVFTAAATNTASRAAVIIFFGENLNAFIINMYHPGNKYSKYIFP